MTGPLRASRSRDRNEEEWARAGDGGGQDQRPPGQTLGAWGALVLGVAGVLAWAWARYLGRRLGGFTGDTLGALIETTEATVLTLAVSLDFLALA